MTLKSWSRSSSSDPNYEEDLILDDLSKNLGKVHIKSVTPGKAVRRKIRKAATQIKKRTNGKLPSLLVFYNNRLLNNPANSYEIRVGMYGFDTIVLAVPNDMSVPPYEIDRKFGGKRQMTENCNTSITGVGVLVKDERGSLQLQVYHNIHAKIPLPHNVLKEAGIKQFTLEPKMQGESQGWTEIL